MFLLGCPLKNILEVRGGLAGSSRKRKLEEAVTSEARMVSVQGMQQESVSGAWMHSTLVFSSSQAITGNDVCKKQSCPWPGRTPVPPRKPSPTARGRSKICRRMSRPAGHMRAHTFRGPLLRGSGGSPAACPGLSLQAWLPALASPPRDSGLHGQRTRRPSGSGPSARFLRPRVRARRAGCAGGRDSESVRGGAGRPQGRRRHLLLSLCCARARLCLASIFSS